MMKLIEYGTESRAFAHTHTRLNGVGDGTLVHVGLYSGSRL